MAIDISEQVVEVVIDGKLTKILDTSTENAPNENEIVSGKEAWANGEKIVGKLDFVLQEKEVTPTTNIQEILPDEGYTALSKVIVNSYSDTLQARVDETKDCSYLFYYYSGTNSDIVKNLNTTGVTSMNDMFGYCSKLTSLDLSKFDTSKVTTMYYMFAGCEALRSLNLSNFDTSNVANMENMFYHCSKLTSLNLNNLNTSSVTTMQSMFNGCKSLTSLDISSFNTSNVKTMYAMFSACQELTSLNLRNFNTSNVKKMSNMFYNCYKLTNLDLSSFDTSNVLEMSNMFYNCSKLTNLDLSNFNTSKVTNTYNTFNNCNSLITVLGTLDMIKVTSNTAMFYNCFNLTDITLKNIKKSLTMSDCSLLSNTTLINTIKELWDLTGSTAQTLTLSTTSKTALENIYVKLVDPTEEQIAQDPNIIYKKNCEVCESTDEGAMLITNYATLKNWTIA